MNNSFVLLHAGKFADVYSAIKFAQDYIKGFMPEAVFKWNVMVERIKYN